MVGAGKLISWGFQSLGITAILCGGGYFHGQLLIQDERAGFWRVLEVRVVVPRKQPGDCDVFWIIRCTEVNSLSEGFLS